MLRNATRGGGPGVYDPAVRSVAEGGGWGGGRGVKLVLRNACIYFTTLFYFTL